MSALLGVYVIWLRELKRFSRDLSRVAGAAVQPALYLFVLGTGIGRGLMGRGMASAFGGHFDFISFLYPGIIGMSLLFTSIFSAISIVWDREFGFLKEVLVAPIPRWAVAVGKAFGGASVALLQGTILLIFAPLVGVTLTPLKIAQLLPLMFLVAFSLTSLGILVAARLQTMEGFQMIMNFLLMPLFFLSGAFFPLKNLPSWMNYLVHLDPLTYGVDALRFVVLGSRQLQAYPLQVDVAVVAAFGAVMLALAVWAFEKTE